MQSTPHSALLSPEVSFWIGYGFGKYVQEKFKSSTDLRSIRIGIGRDCRESGKLLSDWLGSGIEYSGSQAYNVGISTTPAMYYSCCVGNVEGYYVENDQMESMLPILPFHGALSVTASHLPQQWNGFKLFTSDDPTNIGSVGIQSIIEIIKDLENQMDLSAVAHSNFMGCRECPPFIDVYFQFLKQTIRGLLHSHPSDNVLSGLKVCINAGNGAGGFLANCLSELGADTSSSIHLEPDGTFPNHIANPEDKIAITTTANRVIETNADIGMCFDTDVDRVGIIGGDGRILNRNGLIAIASKIVLHDHSLIDTPIIVTDSATSNGLRQFIESLRGRQIRYKKGYRDVIELGRSLPNCLVAMECSGHGGWKDNGWVDDGCYTAIRVMVEMIKYLRNHPECYGQDRKQLLSNLIIGLVEPMESHEIRCQLKEMDQSPDIPTREVLNKIIHAIEERVKSQAVVMDWEVDEMNYEGIRFNIQSDWLMLRPSLHEPILSIQLESNDPGGSKKIIFDLLSIFQWIEHDLDLLPLQQFIG